MAVFKAKIILWGCLRVILGGLPRLNWTPSVLLFIALTLGSMWPTQSQAHSKDSFRRTIFDLSINEVLSIQVRMIPGQTPRAPFTIIDSLRLQTLGVEFALSELEETLLHRGEGDSWTISAHRRGRLSRPRIGFLYGSSATPRRIPPRVDRSFSIDIGNIERFEIIRGKATRLISSQEFDVIIIVVLKDDATPPEEGLVA